VQVRSAQAAIGFEKPKLEAIAVAHLDGDFGTVLNRAIARSAAARLEGPMRSMKVLNAKPLATYKSAAEVSAEAMRQPMRRRI
jgi:hypothetical protein